MSESGPPLEDGKRPSSGESNESDIDGAVLDSSDIFQGAREVQIEHNGEIYRLFITKNNKLILHH